MNLHANISKLVTSSILMPFDPDTWTPRPDNMLDQAVHNSSFGCNRSWADTEASLFPNLSISGTSSERTELLSWHRCNGETSQEELVRKNWAALLILVVVVVTVTGNILVIMAVNLERKLQNATNYFLMSLAVADMLLGLLVMPVSMVTIVYGYLWPLPTALCPMWIYLDVLFSTASIMHLCAISLDRYVAIRNPIRHNRSNSRSRAWAKITAVWTISAGISTPIPVLGLRDHTKVFKDGSCLLTDNSFVLIGSFVAFFVPLTIMVVTYFLTISALQSEATLCLDQLVPRPKWSAGFTLNFLPGPAFSPSEKKLFFRRSLSRETGAESGVVTLPFGRHTAQSISNEQKASKVLGVVFFLFVVMWCPFFITNVLAVVCEPEVCDADVMSRLLNVFVWVGYLSSAVNPLVYTLFNKTYRSAFARYIRCQFHEERKPLQFILVNTIPPLAYQSTHLPFGGSIGNGNFSLPLSNKNHHLSKSSKNESVSCL
ncbi:5-hydroxytryptamine receptor 2A-like [Myxocyprinus asiaticus]|uniref:5-hydroxytryptamine receptor 2A-like n=1 Tax=Myxocyprinus asiaticus TaxID=70543 RepID=UPI00222147A6|nr:5-hydroxytryptamine receptor 2A-like [Myxocyprinus asiaticus]